MLSTTDRGARFSIHVGNLGTLQEGAYKPPKCTYKPPKWTYKLPKSTYKLVKSR